MISKKGMSPSKKKSTYHIHNWREYYKALVQRGSITFWFSEEAINKCYSTSFTGEKRRPQKYSDDAILCALLVRTVYHLPLRALHGFLMSIATLMGLLIKRGFGGDDEARAISKKIIGYHIRSLGKMMMYRIKQLTGSTLRSRLMKTQCTEAYIKCLVINKMTRMGILVSSWEAAA
jgi:hypothetical protein